MRWAPVVLLGTILAGWLVMLFVFSSQSYTEQNIQPFLRGHLNYHQLMRWLPNVTIRYQTSVINSHVDPYRFLEFLFRKGAHLFVYATLSAIMFMFLRAMTRGRIWISILLTLLVALAIPILDEWNQRGSNERTGNATDVMLDFTGGLAGLICCLCVAGVIKLWRRAGRSRGL